jgi:hypothetical protein
MPDLNLEVGLKTDEQDLVAMEDEAIRQGRVVKSIPEPGMVLIVPSPDFEAGWLAARANPPRVEGVVADPKLFKFWGTDDCKSCETGRITLFVANEKCMSCDPDSYRPTPQPAPDERKDDQGRAWGFAMDVFKSAGMSPGKLLFVMRTLAADLRKVLSRDIQTASRLGESWEAFEAARDISKNAPFAEKGGGA